MDIRSSYYDFGTGNTVSLLSWEGLFSIKYLLAPYEWFQKTKTDIGISTDEYNLIIHSISFLAKQKHKMVPI